MTCEESRADCCPVVQRTGLEPGAVQHLGYVCPASYISWSSQEATWHFVDTLYNHLWEPEGNLGALCGVCLNPRQGHRSRSVWGVVVVVMNSWLRAQGNKRGLEQLNIFLLVQTLEHSVLPWLV